MWLKKKGSSVGGGAARTTDSMAFRSLRCCGSPLLEYRGRPLPDIVFPILNSSQNWFAEMLLKLLGREVGDTGSWEKGLAVEKRFLIDSVKLHPTRVSFARPPQPPTPHPPPPQPPPPPPPPTY